MRNRKGIGNIFILVGIVIIAIPIIGKVLINWEQKKLMENFYLEIESNASPQAEDSNRSLEEIFIWGSSDENQDEIIENTGLIENSIEEKIVKRLPKAIGVIEIPKIDVRLPIAEGVDLETLKFTVGHMPDTAELGEIGNTVLAGHRSNTFGVFFNRLAEVEIGDEIEIEKSDGNRISYEVYEKLLVEPDDLSVLSGSNTFRVVTLITCDPAVNPNKRLIIHGIEKE